MVTASLVSVEGMNSKVVDI